MNYVFFGFVFSLLLITSFAQASCPPATMANPDDLTLRFPAAQGVWVGSAASMDSSVINTSTNVEGVVIYDAASKTLKLCDGTNWQPLSGTTGITNAAGNAGEIQFNDGDGNLAAIPTLRWDADTSSLRAPNLRANQISLADGSPSSGLGIMYRSAAVENVPANTWHIRQGGNTTSNISLGNYDDVPAIFVKGRAAPIQPHVGIGLSTPQSRLHVAGGIQIQDDTDTCPGTDNAKLGTIRFSGGAFSACLAGGWSALATSTASAAGSKGEIQFNDGSGNLAASPDLLWDNTTSTLTTDKLHVGTLRAIGNNSLGYSHALRTGATAMDSHAWMEMWAEHPSRQGEFVISGRYVVIRSGSTETEAGIPRLYIAESGDVGIGTTTPIAPLEVNGNISSKGGGIILQHPNVLSGNWARGISLVPDGSIGSGSDQLGGIGFHGSGNNPPDRIYLSHGGSPWNNGNGIYILANGNVGIGTIAPNATLEVAKQSGGASVIRVTSTTGNHAVIDFYEATVKRGNIGFHSAGYFNINDTGIDTIINRTAVGNVGIGNITPTSLLTIGDGTKGEVTDTTSLEIQSRGFASLRLMGDYDDVSGESGGAYVFFGIDGPIGGAEGLGSGFISAVQKAGEDGMGADYEGTLPNSLLIGTKTPSPGNRPLHLGAGNAVQVTVIPSGNVGVGTNTPTEKLEVDGNIRVTPGHGIQMDVIRTVADFSGSTITITPSGTGVVCAHEGGTPPNYSYCDCPPGYLPISGGGHVGLTGRLRETRHNGTKRWIVACTDNSNTRMMCASITLTCMRIIPN